MLRYLILIGALAAMPLTSFAAVEAVDKSAAEPAANVEQSKSEGPVWVVEATKSSPSQGPVWVVIRTKGVKTVS
jgi:hypothetical protein